MKYQKIHTSYWDRGAVMTNGKFEMTIGYDGSVVIQNSLDRKVQLRIMSHGHYLFSLLLCVVMVEFNGKSTRYPN